MPWRYERNIMDGTKLAEVHPDLIRLALASGFEDTIQPRKILDMEGSIQRLDGIPNEIKCLFRTAREISPEWHIRIQAEFQKYTDNAVSKTINLPHAAGREDVAEAYRQMWKLGCKGGTVYRDGSREEQPMNTQSREKETEKHSSVKPRVRPKRTHGFTERTDTGCGKLYVTTGI